MDWNAFISVTVLGTFAMYRVMPKIFIMIDEATKASEPGKPRPRDRYSPPRQFVNSKGEPWCGSAPTCGTWNARKKNDQCCNTDRSKGRFIREHYNTGRRYCQ